MANGKKETGLVLPPLKQETFEVVIIGTTPLIVHNWNQKTKYEMLAKQLKLPKGAKEAKNPVEDFLGSMYFTDDGFYGLPAVALKDAMVTACTSVEGITKVAARQAFRVVGERGKASGAFCDIFSPVDLVRVATPAAPRMREDMVRVGMGTADLRYRAEFWPWAVKVQIVYNSNVLSLSQVVNLLNTAGFAVGLCEWRMEKGGQHGSFKVADAGEAAEVEKWLAAKQPQPDIPDVDAWLAKAGVGKADEKPHKVRAA